LEVSSHHFCEDFSGDALNELTSSTKAPDSWADSLQTLVSQPSNQLSKNTSFVVSEMRHPAEVLPITTTYNRPRKNGAQIGVVT